MLRIALYGPGAARGSGLEDVVSRAVAATGVRAGIEVVYDPRAAAAAGVPSTPAVTLDGRVLCAGRVPSFEEMCAWLRPFSASSV